MKVSHGWAAMVAGAAGLACASGVSVGAPARVVCSTLASSATSDVPGGGGLKFLNFRRPYGSPDGTKWIMVGGTASAGSASTNMMILGSGNSITSTVLPSTVTSWDPLVRYTSFTRNCGINNAGQWAVAADTDAATTMDQVIARFDSGTLGLYAREGDDAGVLGPSVKYGGSMDSVTIDQAGVVSFYSTLTGTPGGSADDSALFYGANVAVQEGSTPAGQFDMPGFALNELRSTRYYRSNDGTKWVDGGTVGASADRDRVALFNGDVVAQEGVTILAGYADAIGTHTTGGLGEINMAPNGDWFLRGSNGLTASNPIAFWVARNGTPIAKESDPLFPCDSEVWARRSFTSSVYFTNVGNFNGDYIVGGASDNSDNGEIFSGVMVLNGNNVVMRSGDPVDLDGNGLADDNIFIRNFLFDDAFITPDRRLFVVVNLNNVLGGDTIAKALISKQVYARCIADFDQSGPIEVADIFAFLNAWFTQFPSSGTCLSADADGNGTVEVADIFRFLNEWFTLFGGVCP